ncbi:YrbL family protein [Microbulbifer yueqingensis]|uniref:PhoP regulatory network protein YrbL n=1 Tax=Microbulbifer yueqingensis TaxID=658219 RepID=A0A1G8Z9P4_9GAMM|nr:YrbL family protein [Microbulbifer yueqingensis]SDK11782.1 PhoP regulatory network protein YrbL [Microbulbifer yueqingensis]
MTISLASEKPFARGGNRLCYVHPDDSSLCIKVRRPDFTLADCRRKKGFPKNLKPLSSFDDNLEESRVMAALEARYGELVFRHVSRCFGFVDTDMGRGLVSELIRDDNGAISQTLKKVIWDEALTDDCRQAVAALGRFWQANLIPSRHLLLHNIVVQRNRQNRIYRLVVIDGLGSPGLIPMHFFPAAVQRKKVEKKVATMHGRIEMLLGQRHEAEFPGYHGLLLHDGSSSQ